MNCAKSSNCLIIIPFFERVFQSKDLQLSHLKEVLSQNYSHSYLGFCTENWTQLEKRLNSTI